MDICTQKGNDLTIDQLCIDAAQVNNTYTQLHELNSTNFL